MSIRSKEEIIEAVKLRFGEEPTDDDLTLIEDISDTYDNREVSDQEYWKSKYEELDRTWRKRYLDRFSSGKKEDFEDENEDEEKRTYADLFKEVK